MFVLFIGFIVITLYILGSYRAVELYKERIKFEKEMQKLDTDYKLKGKYVGYIICGLFSWLSYSALKRSL